MFIKQARLSFPSLFVATSFKPDQKKKFSGTLILSADDPQVEEIKKEMKRVAKEKWQDKAESVYRTLQAQDRLALHDGVTKENYDGFGEGTVFLNASTDKRPGVFDKDRTPLTEEDGRIYAGCYVNAKVEIWAQDNQWGRRINVQLSGIQFAGDGEPFGGGAAPATADDFPALEEEAEDDWAEDGF